MIRALYGYRGARLRVRYLVLTAFVLAAVVYVLVPTIVVVIGSFNAAAYQPFPPSHYTLHWYQNAFAQPDFGSAAVLSVELAITSSIIAVVTGTMAAYALVRRQPRGSKVINTLLLAPIVMPRIILGVGLFIFFDEIGVYGSFWSIMVAHALMSLPFTFALAATALVGLDASLEEAAADLGATRLRAFRSVVLPLIRVPIVLGAVIAFIGSMGQFESTLFLALPGHYTLPIEMYNYLLIYQDPTIAALSTIIIGSSLILVAIIAVFLRHGNALAVMKGAAFRGERAMQPQ
jgi:putative spermidine/putrescine transport system permease protein